MNEQMSMFDECIAGQNGQNETNAPQHTGTEQNAPSCGSERVYYLVTDVTDAQMRRWGLGYRLFVGFAKQNGTCSVWGHPDVNDYQPRLYTPAVAKNIAKRDAQAVLIAIRSADDLPFDLEPHHIANIHVLEENRT